MQGNTPGVNRQIQAALVNESTRELRIGELHHASNPPLPPLTVVDAQSIIACLRENRRFHMLVIVRYDIHNVAVLNVIRNGLPLCTAVTAVMLYGTQLGNEELERLLPAFYNTSITSLNLQKNNIQGQRGGEVLRDLVIGNNTLVVLHLNGNPIGSEGAMGLGNVGFAVNNNNNNSRLQTLNLLGCDIGNEGLANLLLSMGDEINNHSLTDLNLGWNGIQGAEGGRQVSLLLQRLRQLKVLELDGNRLGPLGASALAPGLAAASHLEMLHLYDCGLGNDGVANLVPDGQVNVTLTHLNLQMNGIRGTVGGESIVTLASRCTNLDGIILNYTYLCPDHRRRLDLLLDRKRLCTKASALAGSTFPILFRAVEEAHCHEQGLGAIFVILQNDGDDYFCNANNRDIL